MAVEPFVGQIQAFGFAFAPIGWHFCDGTLMSVSEQTVLFTLIGTTYGGNGNTTFGLPDLRGRVPLHMGQGGGLSLRQIGEASGVESVTITTAQMPAHSHILSVTGGGYKVSSANGMVAIPDSTNNVIGAAFDSAVSNTNNAYNNLPPDVVLNTGASAGTVSISITGSGVPFENMEPFLTINYCIALEGIFPSRN